MVGTRSPRWPTARAALRATRAAGIGLTYVLLTACASYQPRPLADRPDLARSVAALKVDPRTLDIPGLKREPFDAGDGLDDTEIAALAVLNNPTLKATRLQRGERRAQLLQAGLLPDPTLDLGLDHPTSGPDSLNAYTLGISEEIRALRARGAKKAGAAARARQVDLQVLWQEWQVAERARELFVQARTQQNLQDVYQAARSLNAQRYARDRAALSRGDITSVASANDLASLADADTQLRRLRKEQTATRHALHALLGLEPGVKLPLSGEVSSAIPCREALDQAIAALPDRRPDLIALKAGYQSQEAAVRQAIVEQFPTVSVGITRARDTGGVATIGLGVSIGLPLFDRNRGHIAIERATREQLRQAYQARLDEAVGQAGRVWDQAGLLKRQLESVKARIPELTRVAGAARREYEAGDLDAGTYMNVREQALARQAEAIQLEGELERAGIALDTLLAVPQGSRRPHCTATRSGAG